VGDLCRFLEKKHRKKNFLEKTFQHAETLEKTFSTDKTTSFFLEKNDLIFILKKI